MATMDALLYSSLYTNVILTLMLGLQFRMLVTLKAMAGDIDYTNRK